MRHDQQKNITGLTAVKTDISEIERLMATVAAYRQKESDDVDDLRKREAKLHALQGSYDGRKRPDLLGEEISLRALVENLRQFFCRSSCAGCPAEGLLSGATNRLLNSACVIAERNCECTTGMVAAVQFQMRDNQVAAATCALEMAKETIEWVRPKPPDDFFMRGTPDSRSQWFRDNSQPFVEEVSLPQKLKNLFGIAEKEIA